MNSPPHPGSLPAVLSFLECLSRSWTESLHLPPRWPALCPGLEAVDLVSSSSNSNNLSSKTTTSTETRAITRNRSYSHSRAAHLTRAATRTFAPSPSRPRQSQTPTSPRFYILPVICSRARRSSYRTSAILATRLPPARHASAPPSPPTPRPWTLALRIARPPRGPEATCDP